MLHGIDLHFYIVKTYSYITPQNMLEVKEKTGTMA